MIAARSIALSGFGFGARHVALAGLVAIAIQPPVVPTDVVPFYSGDDDTSYYEAIEQKNALTKQRIKRQNDAVLAFVMAAMESEVFK